MDGSEARRFAGGFDLVTEAQAQSLVLLERNVTAGGFLAATPGADADARRYTRIFGRDAAICALAAIGSGRRTLEDAAIASLDSLAAHQAPNGQIPKYVDSDAREADFWYVGCIDATLWWLLAVDHVKRSARSRALTRRWDSAVARALQWLLAQEHQRFFLVQQNEASDWADIMPRSGFVLYTNALWHQTKRRFNLPRQQETRHHANHLFFPFRRDLPTYHRARLLGHYVRRDARNRDMYLSFVNLATFGDEGDVFGNVLAILGGLAGHGTAGRILRALERRGAADQYPVRVVLDPIRPTDPLWRKYMERHQQNHVGQYHNGGIWPFVGGFYALALASVGERAAAWQTLERTAQANRLGGWRFTEWFHGETAAPLGMAGQSWNAAAYLIAHRALSGDASPFV
jgi:hypothetical protein